MAAGLRMVQVREPGWSVEKALDLTLKVKEIGKEEAKSALILVINRRSELAAELDLDGVHVGGGRPEEVSAARAVVGSKRLVGYSAHREEELLEAARHGADYASCSPVFGPISKRHSLPPIGLEGLKALSRRSPIPVYALGGITAEDAASLRRCGASGAAMIGAILDAPDPGAVVRRFLEGWESAA